MRYDINQAKSEVSGAVEAAVKVTLLSINITIRPQKVAPTISGTIS